MNKVTKEELLERLDEMIKWFSRYQSPALQERRDEIDDAVRHLIENMDKQTEVDEERIKKENLANENERVWKMAVRETYDEGYEKGYREGRRGRPDE